MKLHSVGSNKLHTGKPLAQLKTDHSSKKRKLLCWSDSCIATTGFGRVSHHILRALHATGRYEIDQLAINYFGDFYDRTEVPYCLVPARLANPEDPYGNQMFIDSLRKKEYDFALIINDIHAVHKTADHFDALRRARVGAGQTPFKLVYYYPVDCKVHPGLTKVLEEADRSVAYTEFGKQETLKATQLGPPTNVIYHGADTEHFFPIPPDARRLIRQALFHGIVKDDTYVVCNVNRNSVRKNLARTLVVFSEFHKLVPNSILYLHALLKDSGATGFPVDLTVPIQELGLVPGKDIFFPANYNVAAGFPIQRLNEIYNTADVFLTTHLGEGWGLTTTEAMSAGVPVVAPNNTSTPEILGSHGDRGYVYECRDLAYVDNSGYRAQGYTEDILQTMLEAYRDWQMEKSEQSSRRREIVGRAAAFTHKYSWHNIGKEWVKLFEELYIQPSKYAGLGSKSGGELL